MSLEEKSQHLKDIIATYDTAWLLGDLSGLMKAIADHHAEDQLGKLSSPLRQLYFLGGLLVSSDPANGTDQQFTHEKWNKIVELLNLIEMEYDKLFFPNEDEEVNDEWKDIRKVAMPSFLTYFNQGPLNYEEQTINWVRDLYTQLDSIIEPATGLKTEDFLCFYESLDTLIQKNFQSVASPKSALRPDWKKYTKINLVNTAPSFLPQPDEKTMASFYFMADHGISKRFFKEELVTSSLTVEKVSAILNLLCTKRQQTDFLYYTATKPGNPLYEKPIVDIGDGLYQVFEVKQVIHAVENLLEQICTSSIEISTKYTKKKGELLESKIIDLLSDFFGSDVEVFQGYYVDGCEQDILILWKKYALIIEAKGYALREPLRDPNRAFVRIKDDFEKSIGYAHLQTKRVEKKFAEGDILRIANENGTILKEIDTTEYEYDFSIIVNIKSFGQIQTDLSTLLKLDGDNDEVYPWAIKFDDLEIFILTLKAQGKTPIDFINYLLLREDLHGKLICSDESELCGGFLTGEITEATIKEADILVSQPDLASIFDKQYNKGMGFKNEKYLKEKKSGRWIFY